MVNSYDDMMGSEMDPSDHPATSMPQATQHYAGDVVPMPMASSTKFNALAGQASNLLGSLLKTPVDLSNVSPIKKPK